MSEDYSNEEVGVRTEKPKEEDIEKWMKKHKLKDVYSIKITGPMTKKLACVNDPFQLQLLAMQLLEDVSNEDLVKFKSKFVASKHELQEFKTRLDFCDKALQV